MPTYEYKCAECGKVCERRLSIKAEKPPHVMEPCKDPFTFCQHDRILSLSNFQLAGSGWAKDGYK
jgi:putative FmdB family regulatory protein